MRASEIRRPQRHRTAVSARLRIPVGARLEQAWMSQIASASVSTSGGRRRAGRLAFVRRRRGLREELVDDVVEVGADGRVAAPRACDMRTFSSIRVIFWPRPDRSDRLLAWKAGGGQVANQPWPLRSSISEGDCGAWRPKNLHL